ncbi:hypothetical protein ACFORG_14915 [Lutimaribacter marinistellae]|uniref:Uncharacterized protein n=1 Tax=Lutimaribacter marinistellae TaxID=1820329 RepID=A0ABV7THI2_9RHOB
MPVAIDGHLPHQITAVSILAGIGALERRELCSLIALMESINALKLAKGAVEDIGKQLRIMREGEGRDLEERGQELETSCLTTSVLRHRLLTHLATALGVPPIPPLSGKSAMQMAAALAIRASERLTPAVVSERNRRAKKLSSEGMGELAATKAAEIYKSARDLLNKEKPLAFPELVREEMLHMLSNEQVVEAAAGKADPAVREALEKTHAAAQKAIAVGGSWAVFAAIVGNTGFAPYILAAQLSAWIPMVSGPALVSLLATLIHPATVMVGVGALAWYGVGKGSCAVQSQIAARLCVILAMSGTRDTERALANFLNEMRLLDNAPAAALSHLSKRDREALRQRLAFMNKRLTRRLPESAGPPPNTWIARADSHRLGLNEFDASSIGLMTAGEMLWSATAIDERVLEAADFSRSADIGDPLSFALHAQEFAVNGANYALRGYVAERLVLDWLVAEGHDVALAETSSTPGFDLIVDGNPVQVKCGTELSNLEEHFARYPDIPVIANEELAAKAADWGASQPGEVWADLVTTLPGFEVGDIETLIADTIGHAAVLTDPGVLELALWVGALRGGFEVVRGEIPIEDLPAWLIIDGAARGTLGFVGGKAGAWVGLVTVGPAGTLILGPAAACAALFGVGGTREAVTSLLMKDWRRELLHKSKRLHDAVVEAVEQQIERLSARAVRVRVKAGEHGELGCWMTRRAEDDLVAALEKRWDLGPVPRNEQDVIELVISARRMAPSSTRVLRVAKAVERRLGARPGLNEVAFRRPFEAARKWAKGKRDSALNRAPITERHQGLPTEK